MDPNDNCDGANAGGEMAADSVADADIDACPGANRSPANTDRARLGVGEVAVVDDIERAGDGGEEASGREVAAGCGPVAVAPPELDRRRVAHGGKGGRCGDAHRVAAGARTLSRLSAPMSKESSL